MLHKKALITQDLEFSHLFAKPRAAVTLYRVLLVLFSWHLCCLLAPQPSSHCRATAHPSGLSPDLSQLSDVASLCFSLLRSAFTASSEDYTCPVKCEPLRCYRY